MCLKANGNRAGKGETERPVGRFGSGVKREEGNQTLTTGKNCRKTTLEKGENIMAINDVSLTAGMRSNLLSLQGTVDLLNRTQNRLSTGKKVNTAIDNPVSFFAAQALSARASTIDSLKDAMGQAVQTINAADKGIKAISSMIEQAKGIAQSALTADSGAPDPITLSTTNANAFQAGTVGIDLAEMSAFSGSTVAIDAAALTAFTAGTAKIDVAAMTGFTAGTVKTADVSGMASFTASQVTFDFANGGGATVIIELAEGNSVTLTQGVDYTDAATLATAIGGLEGLDAAAVDADTIRITSVDRLFADAAVTGTDVSNQTTTVAGQMGASIEIDGTTYMKGAAANGFTTVGDLGAIFAAEGYDVSVDFANHIVNVSNTDGSTLLAADFTNKSEGFVVVDTAQALGSTIDIDGTTYMKGAVGVDDVTGFANAAALKGFFDAVGGTTYTTTLTGEVLGLANTDGSTLTAADINTDHSTTVAAVDTAQALGTTIDIDGTTYMKGAVGVTDVTGFANTAALVTLLDTAGYAAEADGDEIAVSIAGTSVTVAEFAASAGGIVSLVDEEVAGSTVRIEADTYMFGRNADGFANATELKALLTAAGYASTAGNEFTVSKDGVTVGLADVNGSAGVTANAEVAATVFTIGALGSVSVVANGVEPGEGEIELGATAAETAENLAAYVGEMEGVVAAVADGANVAVRFAGGSDELFNIQEQFNTLTTQLTALAQDSGYKGKNLLSSDTLVVKFEGADLSVRGFDASANGLGIGAATWNTGDSEAKINASVAQLDVALATLRTQSSQLSGNLSIISVRQEFSTNMINTLTEGSDKLTLADTNEEGANMLMLQTRQSLSTTALSLSAQAAQSVLRLFQ
jgi:flagellin-like hook-associated protein FlgL